MPRRSHNDESVVATFTEENNSKKKYMSPQSVRLASHDKTRVAYFHDEGVGNYHYGVCYIYYIFFPSSITIIRTNMPIALNILLNLTCNNYDIPKLFIIIWLI